MKFDKPLKVSEVALETHLTNLADEFSKVVPATGIAFDFGSNLQPLEIGLRSDEPEFAFRNRGSNSTIVLPLLDQKNGLWSWVSYQEQWEKPAAGAQLSFRSAGLTFYLGFKGDLDKPQVFRSEWAGFANWGAGVGYQAPDAGHPHWQFDLAESLAADEEDEAQAVLSELEGDIQLVDVELSDLGVTCRQAVKARRLSKLHFASVAPFFDPAGGGYVHSPTSVVQLRSWVVGTLKYVKAEMQRL